MTTLQPADAPAAPALTRSFHVIGRQSLELLYQHRVLSTQQLHVLLTLPATRAARPHYLLKQLAELHKAGLVSKVRAQGGSAGPNRVRSQPFLWFLTEAGAESVEEAGELPIRPYRVTPESVAGARQAHTLAVNDVGIAFVEHARRLGHECEPLDWTPEVANRIRDGQRRFEDDHVISDSVLNYVHVQNGRRTMLSFFIELDRATMTSARLAAKLHAYGRLYEYVPQSSDRARRLPNATRPAWMNHYPNFPRLLVVLDAAAPKEGEPDRRPHRLAARTEDLYTRTAADVRLSRLRQDMAIGVTTLQQLQQHGPCAPIFTPLLRGTPSARPAPTDLYLSTK
ncbi:replication-relaxation family protein [Streptomyces sp. NPDC092903]|uniref:replication-relaxation family protein n=1 Tax=Streptomyces sp. NPDC092903 TaxID=3366017 RepID=UPI003815D670